MKWSAIKEGLRSTGKSCSGAIRPHKDYLLGLKENLTVDVFLGYRSNSDTAGVEVPYQSLQIFQELQVPFGLSIIIA